MVTRFIRDLDELPRAECHVSSIWPATSFDAQRIAAIRNEAMLYGTPLTRDSVQKRIVEGLGGYVAYDGERVIGFVLLEPAREVWCVCVEPSHQRKGVGTCLVHKALRRIKQLGEAKAVAILPALGDPAFLHSVGFETQEERWGRGLDQ